MKLGEVLIRREVLSPNQVQEVIAAQPATHKKLGEILLERSLISEHDLHAALQEQYWRRNGFWVIN